MTAPTLARLLARRQGPADAIRDDNPPPLEGEPMSESGMTLNEANDLTGDDIAYWMGNPFLDVDSRVAKVLWWLDSARKAGNGIETTIAELKDYGPEGCL